jgi:hypothetical protein
VIKNIDVYFFFFKHTMGPLEAGRDATGLAEQAP